jgi:hypothetical protein
MRLLPSLATLMLLSSAALAQPAPDQPPPPAMDGAPGPGMQPPPPPPGMQGAPATPPRQNWRVRFDMANISHDGRLTREQAQAAGMRAIAVHFEQIDADHKGYVTKQDIRNWHRERQAMRASGGRAPQ